jgi:hypothetical protein
MEIGFELYVVGIIHAIMSNGEELGQSKQSYNGCWIRRK